MVRRVVCGLAAAAVAAGLLAPVPASAVVNCKFVLKNLSLPGRTVESVAETMSLSEDEIRKCQEEAAAKKAAEASGGSAQTAGQEKAEDK